MNSRKISAGDRSCFNYAIICGAVVGFLFGVFTGIEMQGNSAVKAKCTSLNGSYGGGRCYKNGKEIQ